MLLGYSCTCLKSHGTSYYNALFSVPRVASYARHRPLRHSTFSDRPPVTNTASWSRRSWGAQSGGYDLEPGTLRGTYASSNVLFEALDPICAETGRHMLSDHSSSDYWLLVAECCMKLRWLLFLLVGPWCCILAQEICTPVWKRMRLISTCLAGLVARAPLRACIVDAA